MMPVVVRNIISNQFIRAYPYNFNFMNIRAWLQLIRLPNVLTCPADIVAGVAMVSTTGVFVFDRNIAFMMIASMLLYAGGGGVE